MTAHSVIAPIADMREAPDAAALRGKLESQLVFGETFDVAEEKDGWCRGTSSHDGYAGWVEKKHLAPLAAPTHIVTAARSGLYRDATMKSPHLGDYSFGSRVTVAEEGEKFARLSTGEWIYAKHLLPVGGKEEDYLATAKKFLETPYYWGGRSGFGIDCSGLVQVSLALAGIKAPRDTEDQITLGAETERHRTGDLVFFKGHVGIMTDADNILHANAFHMKVTIEPLWQVDARSDGGAIAIRRI